MIYLRHLTQVITSHETTFGDYNNTFSLPDSPKSETGHHSSLPGRLLFLVPSSPCDPSPAPAIHHYLLPQINVLSCNFSLELSTVYNACQCLHSLWNSPLHYLTEFSLSILENEKKNKETPYLFLATKSTECAWNWGCGTV